MHVRDTAHGNERSIVQSPTDDGVDAGIVDLVNLKRAELVVAALPAHKIEKDDESKYTKRCGAAPVD